MKTKFLIVFFALTFVDVNSQNGNVCLFSQTICGNPDQRYDFAYIGNNCNYCPNVPAGAASVSLHEVYPSCYWALWSWYIYSYGIDSNDAASLYEYWGGYCGDCV